MVRPMTTQRSPQQADVGQDLAFVEGEDRVADVGVDGEVAREEPAGHNQEAKEDEQGRRRHVDEEVVEPEPGGGPDQDVRRVADERRRPADVRWPGSGAMRNGTGETRRTDAM